MKETAWERRAVNMDRIAIPLWIILIGYGLYEVMHGNQLAWIALLFGIGGFMIDGFFTIENRKIKFKIKKE